MDIDGDETMVRVHGLEILALLSIALRLDDRAWVLYDSNRGVAPDISRLLGQHVELWHHGGSAHVRVLVGRV